MILKANDRYINNYDYALKINIEQNCQLEDKTGEIVNFIKVETKLEASFTHNLMQKIRAQYICVVVLYTIQTKYRIKVELSNCPS